MKKKPLQANRILILMTTIFVCALLTTACNKKQPTASIPASAQSPNAVVPPKPVQKQTTSALRLPPPLTNQFDFSNKKDPFRPFVAAKAEPKNIPDTNKNALHSSLPIHSFDVSQFRLIGIITGGRESQAMVTDPNGKGYVLKTGMLIGKNDGKITSINSTGVEVLEQFRDDNGKVRKENIKLTLPRKQ